MKYFDTFTGIGGFTLAINNAYDNRSNLRNRAENIQEDLPDSQESSDRPTCVGYSEIDKYASSIYQRHFPNHKNYGDITKINTEELPDFDLLVGGFPCQAFSIAGKRRGFNDTRGTLFYQLARILRDKRPRLFVFENVKGLLSHDKGNTFKTIIATLDELGYDTQWQVLNSKNFGVPQNRERVFIVGHLRGTRRPEVFPIIGEPEENTRRTGEDISYCLDSNYHKGPNTTTKGRRQVVKVSGDLDKRKTYLGDIASTLAANPTSDNIARIITPTNRRTEYKTSETCNTLTSHYRGSPDGDGRPGVLEDMKIRRLTPTECERLQGFPDGWTEGISDTQRYKCCGNAVTVNVVEEIMERLLNLK